MLVRQDCQRRNGLDGVWKSCVSIDSPHCEQLVFSTVIQEAKAEPHRGHRHCMSRDRVMNAAIQVANASATTTAERTVLRVILAEMMAQIKA
jgi:hypothetical protein